MHPVVLGVCRSLNLFPCLYLCLGSCHSYFLSLFGLLWLFGQGILRPNWHVARALVAVPALRRLCLLRLGVGFVCTRRGSRLSLIILPIVLGISCGPSSRLLWCGLRDFGFVVWSPF